MTRNLPAKITAPLPAPTPQHAKLLSPQELSAHRQAIAFDVKVTLSAYFDPSEAEEVKAGLLAWFCDELQDWTHEQVVWALRSWNRENPRRRPTPGDIVALLKKARGEKIARERAASVQPDDHAGMSREDHERISAEMSDMLGAFIRPMPKVAE